MEFPEMDPENYWQPDKSVRSKSIKHGVTPVSEPLGKVRQFSDMKHGGIQNERNQKYGSEYGDSYPVV